MEKRLINLKKEVMEQVIRKADKINMFAEDLWNWYEKEGVLCALNEEEFVDQQTQNDLYKWRQEISRLYFDIADLLKDNKDPIVKILLDELDKATDEMANCICELMDGQYDSTDMREITFEIFDMFDKMGDYCK